MSKQLLSVSSLTRIVFAFVAVSFVIGSPPVSAKGLPESVQTRFVLAEPVWKEIVVRDELLEDYEGVWKDLVDIIIDNGFEIGFMEKDSGYVRTNENAGMVVLKKYWTYDIKVVAKIVVDDQARKEGKTVIEKIRIQVLGHVYKSKKGTLRESYSGTTRSFCRISSTIFNSFSGIGRRSSTKNQSPFIPFAGTVDSDAQGPSSYRSC